MDQAIRNKLRSIVTQCRRLLEESIAQQLQGKYDIYVTGKKDEVKAEDNVSLRHLTDEERQARQDILAHFRHIEALGYKRKETLEQLIREIAFTHLNRLCAYKMMEVRDVYVGGQKFREAVSKGLKSQGFLFYLAENPEEEKRYNAGHQEEAYRHFLNWLGGTLSQEIGVLFSPTDPANRVYPPQRVLDEVLDLLNSDELKGIWSEDETIGWVYQYFTPKELRDQARVGNRPPANSYELAFRNQFFTSRYVVEFLTDNTLGRIWYEMRKGDTRFKDECCYMVRRPTEIFLPEGSVVPGPSSLEEETKDQGQMTNDELLKLPVYIPHRPKKDPREIKILDPACGSGHFLLYCFTLLLVIYQEAYDDPELGPGLQAEYPTLDDLRRAVPGLILGRNLHGIDIDLRAVQIAGLALWLRCQRAYQEMGLKKDRPPINGSNVVCAEPMPGEEYMLKDFADQLGPKLLGQLVGVVFDKMKLAGEAGSLLKIEEEIRDAVDEARRQWRIGSVFAQQWLFGEYKPVERQQRFDLSGITDAEFFEQAESKVVDALRRYAERAQNGQRLQRRLFADDTERGFAFVDLCHKLFDVVLMNPPFGEASVPSRRYLYPAVTSSTQDLCAAFVERWSLRLNCRGLLGAITSRLVFFKELLTAWREDVFVGTRFRLRYAADLGYGVLDEAIVEAAAYIVSEGSNELHRHGTVTFLSALSSRTKPSHLLEAIRSVVEARQSESVFDHKLVSFSALPAKSFPYWCSHHWLDRFSSHPSAKASGVTAKKGLETGDDFRQLRLLWEVPLKEMRPLSAWTPYSKGGEYCPFQMDIHMAFDYRRIDEARRRSNSDLYGKQGLTYTQRTTSNFATRLLPRGALFSPGGPGIFVEGESELWGLLGFTNSSIAVFYAELLVGGGDSSEAGTAARNFPPTIVESMPVPASFRTMLNEIAPFSRQIYDKMQLYHGDETLPRFVRPFVNFNSMQEGATSWYNGYEGAVVASCTAFSAIDQVVARHYGLHDDEWRDLRSQLGRPHPTDDDEVGATGEQIAQCLGGERDINNQAQNGNLPRAVTKLGYKTDLHYERAAFLLNASPAAIARARRIHGYVPPCVVQRIACDAVSYSVGVVLGRWDVTKAGALDLDQTDTSLSQLTVCSPGMLQGPDGFPAIQTPDGYPLRIDWDGIVVDDPDHPDDIIRRVRDVLEVIWKDRADAIEKEACEILGVPDLRGYFRKPGAGGFWDDHVKRYTKSRRKAPIYWLLQSSKKNYALWIYYHRLDKDILFKALLNYVEPKIRREESRLDELRSQKTAAGPAAKGAKKLDKDIERQDAFLSELRDFEEKLRRAANLHLDPDLNDGVVLNIAPLRELVPWKEAKSYWDDLMEGKYEWSSIGKQLREKGLLG